MWKGMKRWLSAMRCLSLLRFGKVGLLSLDLCWAENSDRLADVRTHLRIYRIYPQKYIFQIKQIFFPNKVKNNFLACRIKCILMPNTCFYWGVTVAWYILRIKCIQIFKSSKGLRVFVKSVFKTCRYICVVLMEAWPITFLTKSKSVCAFKSCVAKAWRKLWVDTCLSIRALARASPKNCWTLCSE